MKKLALILTLSIFNMFGLFGQSNEKLSFTKEYYKVLEKNLPNLELISLNELEIKTKFQDNDHTHFLDNAYNEYVEDKTAKSEIITRYVKSSIETYKPKPTFSIDQVVPVIKSQLYVDEVLRITNQDEVNTLYEKYNSELFIFYARDLDNSISYITKRDAKEFNLQIPSIRELSKDNLLEKISVERHGENGYYMVTAGGDYEASLIVVESIWNEDNFQVDGNIIIGIPSRDVVLVTGSNNKSGIETLRKKTNEIFSTGNYVISKSLFIFKDDKFVRWEN